MSPGFVSLLNGLCQNQLATPFNRGRYDFLINAYRDKPNEYWWRSAGIVEELGITTPAPASAGLADTQADLQGRFPGLDPRVVEVMANLIATEGAVVVERDGVAWWVDPGFGEDAPVLSLGYDETLGMVDRRRHPEPGKA